MVTKIGDLSVYFYLFRKSFLVILAFVLFLILKWAWHKLGNFYQAISPFPSLVHNHSYENEFICKWMKSRFHMKGWEPRLALRTRFKEFGNGLLTLNYPGWSWWNSKQASQHFVFHFSVMDWLLSFFRKAVQTLSSCITYSVSKACFSNKNWSCN